MMRCILVAIIFCVYLPSALTQKLKKADKLTLANLEKEIQYLSDDKLEGRRAGSTGEKLASDYLSTEFGKNNLQPKGEDNSWLQPFEIYEGKQINDAHFFINDKELQLNKEYFPFAF